MSAAMQPDSFLRQSSAFSPNNPIQRAHAAGFPGCMSNSRAPSLSHSPAFCSGSSSTSTISRVPGSASPPCSHMPTGNALNTPVPAIDNAMLAPG